jgi:hypothetical protein
VSIAWFEGGDARVKAPLRPRLRLRLHELDLGKLDQVPEPERQRQRRLRATAVVAIPMLAAALWAIAGSRVVFPHLSVNHDEPVYLLQADALRHGHLTLRATHEPSAFTPWLVGQRGHRFVFKYTPVHAALLAASEVVFGTPRMALGLIAAAAALVTYLLAREFADRRHALIATWAFVLCPLTALLSATYLPYMSALALLGACGLFALRARRTGTRYDGAAAGLAGGLAFFARPYDAVLFCLPFAALLAYDAWRARSPRTLLWAGAGAAPAVLLTAGYNAAMTGSVLRFPFWILTRSDTVGFGNRRLYAGETPLHFGIVEALRGLGGYATTSLVFIVGGPVLLAMAVWHVRRHRSPAAIAVAGSGALLVVGYFFFWGPFQVYHGAVGRTLGPFYWLPIVVPLVVLAGAALRRVPRMALVVGGTALLVAELVAGFVVAYRAHTVSQRINRPPAALATLRGPRLVFVGPPWLLHPLPYTRNRADYGGAVVWAMDSAGRDLDVVSAFPGRTPYQLFLDAAPKADGGVEQVGYVAAMEMARGQAFDITGAVRNPTGAPIVEIEVAAFGRADTFLLDDASTAGRAYPLHLRLSLFGTRALSPVKSQTTRSADADEFHVTARYLASADTVVPDLVEHRYVTEWTDTDTIGIVGSGLTWHADAYPYGRWHADTSRQQLDVTIRGGPAVADDAAASGATTSRAPLPARRGTRRHR